MKSKRKEVNKYQHRLYDEVHEEDIKQQIKRNTGNKPFQLTKLRFNRNKLLISNNFQLHQPNLTKRSQQFKPIGEDKQFYLDLIINKKNINMQQNIRLNSQRKVLIYDEVEHQPKDQMMNTMYQSENRHEFKTYKESLKESLRLTLKEQNQLHPGNMAKQLKKRRRAKKQCECCKNQIDSNVKICYKNENNELNQDQDRQDQNTIQQTNEQHDEHNEHHEALIQTESKESKFISNNIFPLHINVHHIYTNIKWRSKSQIFQVDKWKLKYHHDKQMQQPVVVKAKSTTKIAHNIHEGQNNQQKIYKKKYLLTTQNQKIKLPTLNPETIEKGRHSDRQIKTMKIKAQKFEKYMPQQNNSEKAQLMDKIVKMKLQKIDEKQETKKTFQPIKNKKFTSIQQQKVHIRQQIKQLPVKRERRQGSRQLNSQEERKNEGLRKQEQQKKSFADAKKISDELKVRKKKENDKEIIIKKMYSDEKQNKNHVEDNVVKQSQKQEIGTEITDEIRKQESKLSKKKWKFPSIQITTIYSSKEDEDIKRKQKVQKLQKLTKEWRLKMPEKVNHEKNDEEVLQRWQQAGSRQDSRLQVDLYIKIKEQQLVKEQQKRIKEQLYNNYLQNAQIKCEKIQQQILQKPKV